MHGTITGISPELIKSRPATHLPYRLNQEMALHLLACLISSKQMQSQSQSAAEHIIKEKN